METTSSFIIFEPNDALVQIKLTLPEIPIEKFESPVRISGAEFNIAGVIYHHLNHFVAAIKVGNKWMLYDGLRQQEPLRKFSEKAVLHHSIMGVIYCKASS